MLQKLDLLISAVLADDVPVDTMPVDVEAVIEELVTYDVPIADIDLMVQEHDDVLPDVIVEQGISDMMRCVKNFLKSPHRPAAVAESRRLCELPIAVTAGEVPSCWHTCVKTVALLKRTRPSLLAEYRPLRTAGDGNCLYRSVSLLYGTDSYHGLLSLKTAVEVMSNEHFYNMETSACKCPFKDEVALVLPSYEQLCFDTATDGTYADILTVYALSCAINRRIQSFFPPLNSDFTESPLTRLMNPLAPGKPLVVMWSTVGPVLSSGPVTIDYFVPLICELTEREYSELPPAVVVVDEDDIAAAPADTAAMDDNVDQAVHDDVNRDADNVHSEMKPQRKSPLKQRLKLTTLCLKKL